MGGRLMPAKFKIKYSGVIPDLLLNTARARSVWNRMIKENWYSQGAFWHGEFREKHFTAAGAREYGYAPRAGQTGNPRKSFWGSYSGQKQKKLLHQLPLVFTGVSMSLTAIRVIQAKATTKISGCEVVIRSPGFNRVNTSPKNRTRPPIVMRDEMTAVSSGESATIVDRFEGEIQQKLDALNGNKTVVIK